MQPSRTILFFRDFKRFTGGHLKVAQYFEHARHSAEYVPRICFSRNSVWDANNPWRALLGRESRRPSNPDMFFTAGRDWCYLDGIIEQQSQVPVLNLIQHVRHGCSNDERYPFLRRKAIRICVSSEVEDAIKRTGIVNGPTFVIPAASDLSCSTPVQRVYKPAYDILIAALKQPDFGAALTERFRSRRGCAIKLLTRFLPRPEFLRTLGDSRVAVLLPSHTEGFYLPALEAMALGVLVVCPDCVGNRSFCLSGINCLRPDYDIDSIASAAILALELPGEERAQLISGAAITVREHDLNAERSAFLDVLHNASQLW